MNVGQLLLLRFWRKNEEYSGKLECIPKDHEAVVFLSVEILGKVGTNRNRRFGSRNEQVSTT
jgi:hypothetical protein